MYCTRMMTDETLSSPSLSRFLLPPGKGGMAKLTVVADETLSLLSFCLRGRAAWQNDAINRTVVADETLS
jgi:hypothetical protein